MTWQWVVLILGLVYAILVGMWISKYPGPDVLEEAKEERRY